MDALTVIGSSARVAMYAEHVPIIAGACRAFPATFARAVMFAALSARQPFGGISEAVADVDREGEKSRHLFGWKWQTYSFLYFAGNAECVHRAVVAERDPVDALLAVCEVPGLGLVKGAFVLQMLGFDVACLDTRNSRRDSLDPDRYKTRGPAHKQSRAFRALAEQYVAYTAGLAETYWDTWCAEVGPDYGMTAEQCSRLHVDKIVPRRQRGLRCAVPIKQEEIPF